MRKPFRIGCVAAFACISVPAAAQDRNVDFIGNIFDTCIITLGVPGALAVGGTGQTISSKGTTSGTATAVTTSSRFTIEAVPPSSFNLAPSGGGDGVTFTTELSATGVTTLLNVVGSVARPLGLGLTFINVDLTATREQGFPTGTYTATTVLRCTAT